MKWKESSVPVAFSIHHLSGRVPTAIRFEPVPSLLGHFLLHLDEIPHIEKHGRGIGFRVERVGEPRYSAHDLEILRTTQKDMLGHFLDDSRPELIEMRYTLTAHFRDGKEERTQRFDLTFDKTRFQLSVRPQ